MHDVPNRSSSRSDTIRRVTEIDGLRAVAVAGVLYAHVWSFGCGTPPLWLGAIDVNRALSVFGTGVDLFFVISGFCMHLTYGRRISSLGWRSFREFVVGRARRIIPAFAAALLFACFVASRGSLSAFPWRAAVLHLAFVHTLIPGADVLASHFWSLATEWHFYLLMPFLVLATRRLGSRPMLIAACIATVLYRAAVARLPNGLFPYDHQLPARLVEFAFGIAVAEAYGADRPLPGWLRGLQGVAVGFGVMMIGRVMSTAPALNAPGPAGLLAAALNVPLLSAGCALLMWNVISSESIVAQTLRTAPVQLVGRWSYSLYLWHWFPSLWIGNALAQRYGAAPWLPISAFLLATTALVPVCAVSFHLFEAPYFVRRRVMAPTDAVQSGSA